MQFIPSYPDRAALDAAWGTLDAFPQSLMNARIQAVLLGKESAVEEWKTEQHAALTVIEADLKRRAATRQYAAGETIQDIQERRRIAVKAVKLLRETVIARDKMICGVCRLPVVLDELSIDHIIPISRGGSDDLDNLQVAHRICNSRKNNALPRQG